MTSQLKCLKDKVESLNQHHQIQILKIINNNNVLCSENKNGTFVNLTSMNEIAISKIESYLKYVEEQETQLKVIENQKTELAKQYFK